MEVVSDGATKFMHASSFSTSEVLHRDGSISEPMELLQAGGRGMNTASHTAAEPGMFLAGAAPAPVGTGDLLLPSLAAGTQPLAQSGLPGAWVQSMPAPSIPPGSMGASASANASAPPQPGAVATATTGVAAALSMPESASLAAGEMHVCIPNQSSWV